MSERDYREIIDSDVKEKGYEEEQMESELFERKELFWMHEKHKTMPEVQERLENLEIKNIELDGMRERYQEKVSDAIESMYESYPELKSNSNFLLLQQQLNDIENDIANSRKYYNGVVRQYNTKLQTFPSSFIAQAKNFVRQPLFEVSDDRQRENVKVEF